jgi:hypothetical protein
MDIYPGDLARLLYQEQLLKQAQSQTLRDLYEGEDQPYVERESGLVSRIAQWLRQRPQQEIRSARRPRTI